MEKNLLFVSLITWIVNMSLMVTSNKLTISGMKSQSVLLGESLTLTCTTQVEHDTCFFFTPANKSLRIDPTVKSGRIIYHGEDDLKDCGINITKVEEEDHGRWKCVVIVEGEEEVEGSDVAEVTVKDLPGNPVLSGQTINVEGTVNDLEDKNFVVTGAQVTVISQFRANPKVTQVIWSLNDGKNMVTITALDHTETLSQTTTAYENHYSATLDSGQEPWHYIAKLTINNATKADFGSVNKIVVKNTKGETDLSFILVESKGGGGKVWVIVCVVVIVLVVLIVIALVTFCLYKNGKICAGGEEGNQCYRGIQDQHDMVLKPL